MKVAEIATRVKRQFGDEAGAQINDDDIIRWINDAQRELAVKNELLQTTATTAIRAGQDQYHLPPDLLTLRSVRVGGRKLEALDNEQAANWTPNVNQPKGVPSHFSVWGLRFDLFPVPDYTDANDLQLYYTRNPIPVGLSTTPLEEVPELPIQYHNRIVEYCLAQAHELDGNPEMYNLKMGQFANNSQMNHETDLTGQHVYPSISVSSADVGYGSEVIYYE